VFCIYPRTNSDLCHLQYKLIGFYNRDEKCLQRGTDWAFTLSSLRFVLKENAGIDSLCYSIAARKVDVIKSIYFIFNVVAYLQSFHCDLAKNGRV
jgi:hypothetical protein